MKKSPLPLADPAAPSKPPPGKDDLEELLRRHFGHPHFRGKQLEAIQAVLSGRDCFCLMPTGGGKSMCYQIPALARPGIVLVVSPLIALMESQVMALKQKGVQAEYLSSAQTVQVREKIHGELECGKPSLRLLYVTPELVATFGFKSKLKKLHMGRLLSLVAIDEAHCISSWGHDFRPTYRQLSSLKSDLPGVPILALTATAAPKVQKDVIQSLGLHNPVILKASFNRPNIFYEANGDSLSFMPKQWFIKPPTRGRLILKITSPSQVLRSRPRTVFWWKILMLFVIHLDHAISSRELCCTIIIAV